MKGYEIQIRLHSGCWENCTSDDGNLIVFKTASQAAEELGEMFDNMAYSELDFDPTDYRVAEVEYMKVPVASSVVVLEAEEELVSCEWDVELEAINMAGQLVFAGLEVNAYNADTAKETALDFISVDSDRWYRADGDETRYPVKESTIKAVRAFKTYEEDGGF